MNRPNTGNQARKPISLAHICSREGSKQEVNSPSEMRATLNMVDDNFSQAQVFSYRGMEEN